MNKVCPKCGTSCTLARDATASGSVQIFWWCSYCWNYPDPFHAFIPHEYVSSTLKVNIASLTVIERYPSAPKPKCAVCGKQGAQLHHFAPKHLFKDAERWPTNYLCDEHHTEWHAKVTPNMRKRPNGQ